MRRAVRRSHELATTANMVSPPTAHLNQLASTWDNTSPLSITRMSSAPMMAPNTVPTPPIKAVPPMTAAATACSSSPSPIEGTGAPNRKTLIVPPKPASMAHMTKQVIFTRLTGTPIAAAASKKPPVARIQLPKFEPPSIAAAITDMMANQINEARIIPPGPTNCAKPPVGRSLESNRGNPPVRTTANERTMKSIPNVVMKLGILNVKVMKPLAKPTAAAMTSPSSMAGIKGTPAFVISAMHTGMRANIEPTDKSNSPKIITRLTPIRTRPTAGSKPNIPRRFSAERNTPCERILNTTVKTISSATPANSGFLRQILNRLLTVRSQLANANYADEMIDESRG